MSLNDVFENKVQEINILHLVFIFLAIFIFTLTSSVFFGLEKTTIQDPRVEIHKFTVGITPQYYTTVTVYVNVYNPNKIEGHLKNIDLHFYLTLPKGYTPEPLDWFYLGRLNISSIDDVIITEEALFSKNVIHTDGDKIKLRAVGSTPLQAWKPLGPISFLKDYIGLPGGTVVIVRIEGNVTTVFGETYFTSSLEAQIKTGVIVVELK